MSWQALAWVENIAPRAMDSRMRFVLWQLAYHHNGETGQCNPSIRRLNELTGLSTHTIQRALSQLEQGWLSVEQQHDSQGRNISSQYHLNIEGGVVATTTAPPKTEGIPLKRPVAPQKTEGGLPLKSTMPWYPLPHSEENSKENKKEEQEGPEDPTPPTPPSGRRRHSAPEAQQVFELYSELGWNLSMNAKAGLQDLIRRWGQERVMLSLQRAAADKTVRSPIAWLRTMIPQWERAGAFGAPDGQSERDKDWAQFQQRRGLEAP